jgi:hypothetical protein
MLSVIEGCIQKEMLNENLSVFFPPLLKSPALPLLVAP